MEFEVFHLENGIRVVHSHRTDSIIAHFGIVINAGSRDEKTAEHGLAHYTEHCLFKGTKKRKFYHILSRLDAVGGELDAFTSKEETSLYASFMDQYYERAIELLSDILFNSVFPEKEIIKEKDVIIDEIRSYQDNPYEQIYDDFEQMVFGQHAIGHGILGEIPHIRKFKKNNVTSFMEQNYTADRMVISSVGNITTKRLKKLLNKYFESTPFRKNGNVHRQPFDKYLPIKKEVKKNTSQAHLAFGAMAYDAYHPGRDALALLNNLLGGPAMNNRLNLNIREKYGFTYLIESQYTAYSDTGLFYIYAGTDKKKIDRTQELITKELLKLKNKKLSPTQLHRAKNQLIGQIAIGRENRCNQMLAYGKSLSLYDEIDTIEKIHERIEKISSAQVFEAANEIFNIDQFSELRYL